MGVITARAAGLLVSCMLAVAAVVACRPSNDVGYVEIKTVPVAAPAQTALYLDSTRLKPMTTGSTVLRQPVGTLELETDGFAGTLTRLCSIEVRKDRITTVTVSVFDRPPRCQCRYKAADGATARECVS